MNVKTTALSQALKICNEMIFVVDDVSALLKFLDHHQKVQLTK
jgi:hypothetical protein